MILALGLPPLAEGDVGIGPLLKLLLFLALVVIAVVNAAIRKGRALMASRARPEEPTDADGSMRAEVLDRVRPRDEPSSSRSARPGPAVRVPAAPVRVPVAPVRVPLARLPVQPSPADRVAVPSAAHARRKGLVADAHVDVGARLPTADDMPGAHSAHDHVHLTEIGADRGTAPKHPGSKPTAAAKVARREGRSGYDLLRARDLDGRDRVRAGILWAEVFGPPRSRARR